MKELDNIRDAMRGIAEHEQLSVLEIRAVNHQKPVRRNGLPPIYEMHIVRAVYREGDEQRQEERYYLQKMRLPFNFRHMQPKRGALLFEQGRSLYCRSQEKR